MQRIFEILTGFRNRKTIEWDEMEVQLKALRRKNISKTTKDLDVSDAQMRLWIEKILSSCLYKDAGRAEKKRTTTGHFKSRKSLNKRKLQKEKEKKNKEEKVARALEALSSQQAYLPNGKVVSTRRQLSEDISNGLEANPVRVFCDAGTSSDCVVPKTFVYASTNEFQDVKMVDDCREFMVKCNCRTTCTAGRCSCIKLQNKVNGKDYPATITKDGRVKVDLPTHDIYSYVLVLCGDHCGCSRSCPNRIENIRANNSFELCRRNVQVGFGVRTHTSIGAGELLMEYVGRVQGQSTFEAIADEEEASQRAAYSYEMFEKDSFDYLNQRIVKDFIPKKSRAAWAACTDHLEEQFVDAFDVGNVSRFLNYSCYPNVVPVRVISNQLHPIFHRIFVMAMCPISAGSELTLNYGPEYKRGRGFKCIDCSPLCSSGEIKNIHLIIPLKKMIDEMVKVQKKQNLISHLNDAMLLKREGSPATNSPGHGDITKRRAHLRRDPNGKNWTDGTNLRNGILGKKRTLDRGDSDEGPQPKKTYYYDNYVGSVLISVFCLIMFLAILLFFCK